MKYELAKLLEQAGFPQGGKGTWIGDPDALLWRSRVYAPTLEELIEACGDRLELLQQTLTALDHSETWTASCSAPSRTGHGKSPAEAVADLWLALQ